MKKKLLIAAGILVALVVIGVATVAVMIDSIVQRGVESSTSEALGVPTRLGEARVSFSGSAVLRRFEADNAQGFTEPRAVAFERLDVALRPRELLGSTVHVDTLTVVKPELTLEFSGVKNNFAALMDNLSSGGKGDGKKFLIRKLRIESGVVRFKSDLIAAGTRGMTLPAIELENIGTGEGGATMAEILRVLLQTLGTAALNAGEGILPRQLLETLRTDVTKRLNELPQQTLDELRKRLEDAKTRELDPARVEHTLRDLLEKKAD
jgi:hypothetical protein